MKNYESVVDKFVVDLDNDYASIESKPKQITEGKQRVHIHGTGLTYFDGKSGLVDKEDGDEVTVLVDFNEEGKKVRQTFNRNNLEFVENEVLAEDTTMVDKIDKRKITEDDETEETGIEPVKSNDVIELDTDVAYDPISIALAELVGDDDGEFVRKYPEEEYGYDSHVYGTEDGSREYLVCTYEEAEEYAKDSLRNLIDDLGPIDAVGEFAVENYLDADFFQEMLEEDAEWYVDDLSDDDVLDEAERRNLIDTDTLADDYEVSESAMREAVDNFVSDHDDEYEDLGDGTYREIESGITMSMEELFEDKVKDDYDYLMLKMLLIMILI